MTTIPLPLATPTPRPPLAPGGLRRIALVGNPNAGKTTLFNALTGLRAKTSNFPGTTISRRIGSLQLREGPVSLVDLPGLYSLDAATPEERVARDVLLGRLGEAQTPDAVILVLDATNLDRNLFLASQVLPMEMPTVAVLTMVDAAEHGGIHLDVEKLAEELGCPVVPVNARKNEGLDELRSAMEAWVQAPAVPAISEQLAGCTHCSGCPFSARYDWAERVGGSCASQPLESHGRTTERLDRFLTHPVVGVAMFAAVMVVVFWMIFTIAQYPMGWVESLFAVAGEWVAGVLPAGDLRSLLVDGVIGGVGGMLVFLPQICILFFFLSLLEDSGYMARAVFVMDRLMHRVGLPGKAFVPLLSAHACAIPAIMTARTIEDRRDRLVTIMVAPLMTCSARVPVYALVVSLLFSDQPGMASVTFTAAYTLGIVAALSIAFLFKRTILKGDVAPTMIELPNYKAPSLRNALLLTLDRSMVFVKKAGTVILLISVVLWAMATYPKTDPPAEALALQAQAAQLEATLEASSAGATDDSVPGGVAAVVPGAAAESAGGDAAVDSVDSVDNVDGVDGVDVVTPDGLRARAEHLTAQHALDYSLAGRLGNAVEPVFAPLGFDSRISIGVLSSFAAREVIVSTLAVLYGVGADAAVDGPEPIRDVMLGSRRADGTPVFTTATCLSLLVFYVLAMQCLPTQVVTQRETGSWGWAGFQLGYMTVLAYTAALVTYQVAALWT